MTSERRPRLPRTVVLLGVVSLLSDAASDMIVPLLPAFLSGSLGGGALMLGWIEGIADALASLLKLFAGRWSDRIGRYRPFVSTGYTLSAVVKPLIAAATLPWHAVLVRALDRTGKGLRTSPRDALIAAAVPQERRGEAFGFHRAMDHAGAVIGPLNAILVLHFITTDLRTVFWLAAIPSLLSVACLFLVPAEPRRPSVRPSLRSTPPSAPLVRFLVPLAVFTLGNASDLFLLLKASSHDAPLYTLPLLWLGLHIVKAISSLYAGRLTDRVGPLPLIVSGWIVYGLVYGALAFAESQAAIISLCLVYGTYHGLTEGAEKTLVARLSPSAERGSSFGWYHLTIGLLALPASVIFGAIWQSFGSRSAFLFGASLAAAACMLLVLVRPRTRSA